MNPKPLMALCLGYSSPSSSTPATDGLDPLKRAVDDLERKLSQIREVLERADLIHGEEYEVRSWLENLKCLKEEICIELEERWQQAEAVTEDSAVAVKVFCSIPCVRSSIKRGLKTQNPNDKLLKIIKELSERVEFGFKDDDVMKFKKLSYLTTCDLSVLPVRGQIYAKDNLLKMVYKHHSIEVSNKVIYIEGDEGSGKTTVAQMVYNDERVRDYFPVRKWVCISGNFDENMNRIRRELVEGKEDIANPDDFYGIKDFFSGKRFLLVLDNARRWIYISSYCESLLYNGAPGSVILAMTCDDVLWGDRFFVDPLSTSDCWSIIKRTALSGKPQLHRRVRNIGWTFAEKCQGSPLDAKIVGEFLKSKATAQEWKDALGDDQLWKMKKMRRQNSRYKEAYLVLQNWVPYCAVFPKDSHISDERLVALCAATMKNEKYQSSDGLITFLDFVDVKRLIHKNKLLSYKLNEASYSAAQRAFPEFTMLEQQKKLYSKTQSLASFVIVSHCELPIDLFTRLKSVKALVLSCCQLEHLSDEVATLDHLEFLDLSGNPLKLLPEKIGRLKYLESLHLHSCYLLLSLPQSIGDLESLRHLRINQTAEGLQNLPLGFEKLTSMRTVDVFWVGGTYENIGKLKKLNDLVDIRITVHGRVCFSNADLQNKCKLENLELCFIGKGQDQDMEDCVDKLVPPANLEMLLIEDYHGLMLPMWIFINKLKRLSLKSNVNISSLPALWTLSSLEFLWLYDMPSIKQLGCEFFGLPNIQKISECDDYYSSEDDNVNNYEITEEGQGENVESAAFHSLKTLRIEYLENLEKWEDADGQYERQIKVMPCLKELIIDNCPKLQGMPLRILRDTPWFNSIAPAWEDKYDKIQAVDVGKHDYYVWKLEGLSDYHPIRIAIHGKDHLLASELKNKSNMLHLELCFVGDGRDRETALSIEELVPPPELVKLRIDDYAGLRLPNWILAVSIIKNLRMLSVRSCPFISCFPSLWKLERLEFLWLFDIPCMKHLGREFFGVPEKGEHHFLKQSYEIKNTNDSKESEHDEEIGDGHAAFPSLKILRIEYLHNLETWEDIDEADEKRNKVMPFLRELIISDCPKLQVMSLRIFKDRPWLKKEPYGELIHLKYQPSTSRGNEIETKDHGNELCHMNDQTNDKPSTSNSKGKATEIEDHGQLHQIDDHSSKSSYQKEVNNMGEADHEKNVKQPSQKGTNVASKASYIKLKNFIRDAYMTKAPAQPLKVSIPKGVLGKERVTSYLPVDSLHDWFEKDRSIFGEQMCVWSKHIYELMETSDKERVQMASSALIKTVGRQEHPDMRAEDLVDFMMENKAQLYLVPFLRPGHWELLAIIPETEVVYWFDSLQGNISLELTEFLNMVQRKYANRNLNSAIAHDSWKVVDIKHKIQVDNWESGYYVMIWMKKIALEIHDLNLESHFPTDTSSYEPDKLRDVDWKWCAHVMPEIPA